MYRGPLPSVHSALRFSTGTVLEVQVQGNSTNENGYGSLSLVVLLLPALSSPTSAYIFPTVPGVQVQKLLGLQVTNSSNDRTVLIHRMRDFYMTYNVHLLQTTHYACCCRFHSFVFFSLSHFSSAATSSSSITVLRVFLKRTQRGAACTYL